MVEGFETGGNDYLKKPFGMAELIVRIKALLHKVSVQRPEATSFRIGLYTFDSITQTLVYRGEKQLLSNRESEILKRLCDNKCNRNSEADAYNCCFCMSRHVIPTF